MNTLKALNLLTPIENLQSIINLLRYIVNLLDQNNIEYWVISATLLGAVRDQIMLPWYDDADISIDSKFISTFFQCIQAQNILSIRRLPDRYRLFWNNEHNEHNEHPYPFVDLFPCNICNDCNCNYITYTNNDAFLYFSHEWFTYDELFPLKKCRFEDFYVSIPQNPYRYLDLNFPKWRTHGRTNGYINSTRKHVDVIEFKL